MISAGPSVESAPWIWWGLHGTFLVLVVVGVVREATTTAVVIALGLAVWQLVGITKLGERPAWSAWWLVVLTIGWSATTLLGQTEFVWLAFPLFFFQLFLFPFPVGVVMVAATTAVVVTGLDGDDSLHLSEVLGPLIGASVAVGAVTAYRALAAENQRNRQLVADLAEARDRLAETERQRGVLEERRRLAREVHDTIAQGLSSILLLTRAEVLAPGEQDRVAQIGEIALENLAEARRIVAALSSLDRSNLAAEIDKAVRLATTTCDTEFEVETVGEPSLIGFESEFALLRVAQGALANVAAHSKAQQARVILEFEEDMVILQVIDDGVGFDTTNPRSNHGDSSFGIQVMRERVQTVEGSLTVESQPDHGTAVTARIPRIKR